MSEPSFVLRALKILGPEEILKLSELPQLKEIPLKKAAGEELIVWDEVQEVPAGKRTKAGPNSTEAQILPFPQKHARDLAPELTPESTDNQGDDSQLMSSDVVLWQREISRNNGEVIHKMDAFNGYRKSTDMYVVKSSGDVGKDKIRFASINGVLVNKKQA